MTPEAFIVHQTDERIRFRIPSEKGNGEYFALLVESILKHHEYDRIEANPLTGSLLIVQKDLEIEGLIGYAEMNHLFSVKPQPHVSITEQVSRPIGSLNQYLHRFTKGDLDLSGLAFVALCGAGLIQILRGNLRAPPWYTAYWYAFGILTKTMADKSKNRTNQSFDE